MDDDTVHFGRKKVDVTYNDKPNIHSVCEHRIFNTNTATHQTPDGMFSIKFDKIGSTITQCYKRCDISIFG